MYLGSLLEALLAPRVHNPPECATPIQLCVGSWSSGIGSSDVMRTLHTSARPVSRQGTIVFDPRVPATPRVPLRCVRYYDAKIRFRSTKTLCRAGSGVAHSGGLCTLACTLQDKLSVPRSCFWLTIFDGCGALVRRNVYPSMSRFRMLGTSNLHASYFHTDDGQHIATAIGNISIDDH